MKIHYGADLGSDLHGEYVSLKDLKKSGYLMENISLSLKEAESFLKSHKRHYVFHVEPIAAIGLRDETGLHGVALLGRTKEGEAQVAHIYVDGSFNGYSLLYGCCVRALMALGYKRLILK